MVHGGVKVNRMTRYRRQYEHSTRQDLLDRITELETLLGAKIEQPPQLGMTIIEWRALGCLLVHRGVSSREHIFAVVWGADSDIEIKSVDVYLVKIRAKLRPFGITIESVRRGGWYLTPEMKNRIHALTLPQVAAWPSTNGQRPTETTRKELSEFAPDAE